MSLLNSTGNNGSLSAALQGGVSSLDQTLNAANRGINQFTQALGGSYTASSGLPSENVPSGRFGVQTRNIAYWFVPEVGIVNMYINPQSIQYQHKKLITPTRTKGGYVVQYWGEEFSTLSLRGHTGSSGVEGLNVLYEIYRAEQIMFDPIALSMSADNSIAGMGSLVDSAIGNLGGISNSISNATSGILNFDPASQNILPRNIPSLASMALGVELYYSGWIFRGYFNSMSYNESVEKLGLFDYDIQFTVTERRGYRTNTLPWQRSAINGPSNTNVIPYSFGGIANPPNLPANAQVAASGRGPFSIG